MGIDQLTIPSIIDYLKYQSIITGVQSNSRVTVNEKNKHKVGYKSLFRVIAHQLYEKNHNPF